MFALYAAFLAPVPSRSVIVIILYTDQSAFGDSWRLFNDNFRFGFDHRCGWRHFDRIADIGRGYVFFLTVRAGLITEGDIAFSVGGTINLGLGMGMIRETEAQYGSA